MTEARAALEDADAEYAAMVTDVVLGAERGLTLLDDARRRHPGARIVVISGYDPDPSQTGDLLATGARFLPKPFDRAALLDALPG